MNRVYVPPSTHRDRVLPMLYAARCFVLVSPSADRAQTGKQALITETDPIAKARRIVELRAGVLIPAAPRCCLPEERLA